MITNTKENLLTNIDQVLKSETSTLSQEDRDRLIEIKVFVQLADWDKNQGQIVELWIKWLFRGVTGAEMARKLGVVDKLKEWLEKQEIF